MEQEISIVQLIANASLVVQIVIGILLLFSIMSWGIIFSKWFVLAKAKLDSKTFLQRYRVEKRISSLFNSVNEKQTMLACLFYQGISEYNRLVAQEISDKELILSNVERALNASVDSEVDRCELQLATLATFGSVSPYIGLLGTVWGIMHAFIGLGNTGQATLASVAPGIAEALVATAIGLFVAIPAYIFYNKFSADISSLHNQMTKFGDEFLNLLNRRLAKASHEQHDEL